MSDHSHTENQSSSMQDNPGQDDWNACMLQVQKRDKQAYARLFRYFAPRLKAYASRQLGNEQTAMEAVHETMAVVWQKSHLFDAGKSALSTWLFTIIRNYCFDLMRRNRGAEGIIHSDDIWSGDRCPPDMIEHYSPEQDRFKQQVLKYLHRLPKKQREVLQAVYLQELPQKQVAEQFNIPLGTVKSRLKTAIEQLRESIDTERL